MHTRTERMMARFVGAAGNSYFAPYTPSFYFDFLSSPNPIRPTGLTTTTTIDADGTFVNSAGLVTQKTANVWPLDYSPSTLQPLGRPVWEARTNLLLNSLLNGTNLSTQSVTLPASAHTLSFYGTGTVTLSGASTAGPLVGTGAYPNRVTLTFTPSAGSVTFTVTGTVQYAQLEAGSFATPFIPTAGAAVTRSADACSIALAGLPFNATEGTFVVEFIPGAPVLGAGNDQRICEFGDGTANESMQLYRVSAALTVGYAVIDGGVLQANIVPATTAAQNSISRVAAAYIVNNMAQSMNGAAASADLTATVPTVTTLYLGQFGTGTARFNGWLRKLYYYPVRTPNSQLIIYSR